MKKLWGTLGVVSAVSIPLVAMVSCGATEPMEKETKDESAQDNGSMTAAGVFPHENGNPDIVVHGQDFPEQTYDTVDWIDQPPRPVFTHHEYLVIPNVVNFNNGRVMPSSFANTNWDQSTRSTMILSNGPDYWDSTVAAAIDKYANVDNEGVYHGDDNYENSINNLESKIFEEQKAYNVKEVKFNRFAGLNTELFKEIRNLTDDGLGWQTIPNKHTSIGISDTLRNLETQIGSIISGLDIESTKQGQSDSIWSRNAEHLLEAIRIRKSTGDDVNIYADGIAAYTLVKAIELRPEILLEADKITITGSRINIGSYMHENVVKPSIDERSKQFDLVVALLGAINRDAASDSYQTLFHEIGKLFDETYYSQVSEDFSIKTVYEGLNESQQQLFTNKVSFFSDTAKEEFNLNQEEQAWASSGVFDTYFLKNSDDHSDVLSTPEIYESLGLESVK